MAYDGGDPVRVWAQDLYNRSLRWSRIAVFARIFKGLARPRPDGATIMIDSTQLKAHRTGQAFQRTARQ